MFTHFLTLNQLKILSQTLAQGWSAVLQLASIPIYFLLLGIESYGLLGIFAAVESLIILIDMTISSSVSREIARKLVLSSRGVVKNFIIIVGKYYFGIVFFSLIFFYLIVYLLLAHTLYESSTSNTIYNLSAVVTLTILLRLSISFSKSILIGDQKQISLSVISSIFITLRIIGSFLLLYFVTNDITHFLMWHLVIFVFEFITLIIFIHNAFGNRINVISSDFKVIGDILSFAPNMFFIAFTSLIITQSDRILISLNYNLNVLGEYNYSKNFVLGMFIISGGIFAYLYPTLSSLFVNKKWSKIKLNCEIICSVVTWLIFPAGIALIFLGNNFFDYFISNNSNINNYNNNNVLEILVIGTIVNLLWMVPYSVQLASGNTIIPLMVNLIFVPITIIFTWIGFDYFNTLSAPIIYLLYNICMLIFGIILIDRYISQINFIRVFLSSMYIPFMFGVSLFIIYFYKIANLPISFQIVIILISLIFVLVIAFRKLKMLES